MFVRRISTSLSLFREIIFDDCVLLIEIIYDVTGVSVPGLCD